MEVLKSLCTSKLLSSVYFHKSLTVTYSVLDVRRTKMSRASSWLWRQKRSMAELSTMQHVMLEPAIVAAPDSNSQFAI